MRRSSRQERGNGGSCPGGSSRQSREEEQCDEPKMDFGSLNHRRPGKRNEGVASRAARDAWRSWFLAETSQNRCWARNNRSFRADDKFIRPTVRAGTGKRSPRQAACPSIASGFSEKDAACLPFAQHFPKSRSVSPGRRLYARMGDLLWPVETRLDRRSAIARQGYVGIFVATINWPTVQRAYDELRTLCARHHRGAPP
jgi:hypothetical protein